MKAKIDKEFQMLIPALSADEYDQLEKNIISDGCREAVVVWNGVIVDGHNRHNICLDHNLPYKTASKDFDDRDSAKLWIIDNQSGRRNINDFVRAELQLHKKAIIAARAKANQKGGQGGVLLSQNSVEANPIDTQKELAKAAGVSHDTIHKVEQIMESAGDELLTAVRAGAVSINAAATIATLPPKEQGVIVAKGDKAVKAKAKEIKEKKKAVSKPKKTNVAKVIAALNHLSNSVATGADVYRNATDKQQGALRQEIKRAHTFINQMYNEVQNESN